MIYIKIDANNLVTEVMNTNTVLELPWIEFEDWDIYKNTRPSDFSIFDYKNRKWVEANIDLQIKNNILSSTIINKRNELLIASDWTQLPDAPLPAKEAWAVYRQNLRDITSQPGYPSNVTWPIPPQ